MGVATMYKYDICQPCFKRYGEHNPADKWVNGVYMCKEHWDKARREMERVLLTASALISEEALKKDWLRAEEDEAWKGL